MFRKILALIVTVITLWVIKETWFVFTTTAADVAASRNQLKIVFVSILIPLLILCFLLWRPGAPKDDVAN